MFCINNLCKKYSNGKGVHDITFTVESSSVTAVIGPNGAGKSTIFNTINGLLTSDKQSCLLDGSSIEKIPLAQMGFLPETRYMMDSLSIMQMIDYMVTMRGLKVSETEINYMLEGFSISSIRHHQIGTLSQGLRKRVAILCAVIGNPKLVVLDEPLNALDIQSVLFVKKIIKNLKSQEAHILISSHILDFLDDLADQVVFLKDGRIICVHQCMENNKIENVYKNLYGLGDV